MSPPVVIGAADWKEYHGGPLPTEGRLYANKSFRASDGTFIQAGRNGRPSFYQRFDLTLNDTTIRIEDGDAYATTDSDKPDVTYTLKAYDAKGHYIEDIFHLIKIYPTPNPATWGAITEYSKSVTRAYPSTYMSSQQIENRLATIVDGALKSSAVQLGVVKLDVNPVDLTNPIAVSANSPAVTGKASISIPGKVKLDVAPDDPENPIAVGINSPAVTTPASPAILGKIKLDVFAEDPANPIAVGANSPLLLQTEDGGAVAIGPDSPRLSKDLTLDYGNNFTAAKNDILTDKAVLAVTAPVTVAADTTLPDNIQLDVHSAGLITVMAGKTFNVASLLDPGNRQIFAGGGNVRLGRGSNPYFNTAWFTGPTTGADITYGLNQLLLSCAANHGGRILIPSGLWTTAGEHAIPTGTIIEGASRHGYAGYATTIRLTAAGASLFKVLPNNWDVRIENATLDGNSLASTTGLMVTPSAADPTPGGPSNIVSSVYLAGVTVANFNDGVFLDGTLAHNWQIRQIHIDRTCVMQGNIHAGLRIRTSNSNVYVAADFFIPNNADGILVESVGGLIVENSEFAPVGSAAGIGQSQFEKQTVVAAAGVTHAGTLKSHVVAAGIPGGFVDVFVPLTTADSSAGIIANKLRAALSKNPIIMKYFLVAGLTGDPDIFLGLLDPAAKDDTYNFTIESTGGLTGLTDSPTSSQLLVDPGPPPVYADGVAPTPGGFAMSGINITGVYAFIGMYNTQDEGVKYLVRHNYANSSSGVLMMNNCLIQGQVAMLQPGRVLMNGCAGFPKFLRDAPLGSGSNITLISTAAGPYVFIGGAFRACEQRAHNFSDATGTVSSTVIEVNALNSFAAESVFSLPTRFIQPASQWSHDPLEPWVSILHNQSSFLEKQRLLRLGRDSGNGFADFYYDFWRDNEYASGTNPWVGWLRIDGNQADPFKGLKLNCAFEPTTVTFTEQAAPVAPTANRVIVYAEDDGSGKTRLMAKFPTGAAQQIAIEP